jgi:hypothetical protein
MAGMQGMIQVSKNVKHLMNMLHMGAACGYDFIICYYVF